MSNGCGTFASSSSSEGDIDYNNILTGQNFGQTIKVLFDEKQSSDFAHANSA